MSLVLDTNVLMLLVAGTCLGDRLTALKRLNGESLETFGLLLAYLDEVPAFPLIVPPHVLAETSNLLVLGANDRQAEALRQTLADFVPRFDERSVELSKAALRTEYHRLGLTDAVLLCLARTGSPLLTKDGDLYRAALHAGYAVTNFNYLIGNYH